MSRILLKKLKTIPNQGQTVYLKPTACGKAKQAIVSDVLDTTIILKTVDGTSVISFDKTTDGIKPQIKVYVSDDRPVFSFRN